MSASKPCADRSNNHLQLPTDSKKGGSSPVFGPTLRRRSPIDPGRVNKSSNASSQFLQVPPFYSHQPRLGPSSPRTVHDRMIPSRSQTDLALAQHLMLSPLAQTHSDDDRHPDGSGRNVTRMLNFGGEKSAKQAPMHVMSSRSPSPKSPRRQKIPTKPDRVMAAPGTFVDIGYQSAHWAPSMDVVVALESGVYVCKIEEDGSVVEIQRNADAPDDPFCHVMWSSDGNSVICGKLGGHVRICNLDHGSRVEWSLNSKQLLRSIALERQHLLTCGTVRNGAHIYDVRKPGGSAEPILALRARSCVNCLSWSPNGHLLAGGCQSGLVYLWDVRRPGKECATLREQERNPVKVVNWCPWKPSVLLTGSTFPRPTICLQNTATGVTLGLVDCATQVTGIQFNDQLKQVASSHHSSEADNRQMFPGSDSSVQIWQFASNGLIPILELGQHEEGIVSMAASINSSRLLTMGGDELLCLWQWSETGAQSAPNRAGQQAPRSQLDLANLIR